MGQPVEQRAGEPFRAKDLGPFVEGQIRGHQRRRLLVALGEDLEQQLGAGLRQRHVAELVHDQQILLGQAVYFNEFVGGPIGAFARFDMDYWGNCLLEAVAWSARTAQLSGRPIAISGNPWALIQLDSERFPSLYFTPPQRRRHHLSVYLNRGSVEGVTRLANREDVLYRVRTADGAVLCVVVPGPAYAELRRHVVFPPPEWLPESMTRG